MSRPLSLYSALSTRYSVLILLLAYFLVGGLFAIFTPPWQAPDEPAHYNYVAQVARDGCCPRIEIGDWDSPYLEQLKALRFKPSLLGRFSSIQYEDHQPPLYYLLQTPLFLLTKGSLIALRLLSVTLGAGIVVCAYALGRAILPERPQVALAAAALVAFLPQHIAILASVNNDALGNLIIAVTLLATVYYMQARNIHEWHLGLLVGIGLLTKVSTIFLVGLLPLAIIMRSYQLPVISYQSEGTPHSALRTRYSLLSFAIPVLLLAGIWWLHSINVYGFPDVFGLRQHDRVVTDQGRTADLIAQIGFPAYLSRALETTYNSFWGQFGWMGVPMPGWIYQAIFVLLLVSGSGLIVGAGLKPVPTSSNTNRGIWLLLIFTVVIALLQYIYYNTVFLQLQGRYMFTGLLPFALFMALGMDGWRGWLAHRFPLLHPNLTVLPFALFALLDVYLLWKVIVPALMP
jgi:4-amino-4-deoxy-L-arabinose transferase-like glycosyltransferase